MLQEWRDLVPASQTLLWMGGEEAALKQHLDALRRLDFAAITQLQIHVHVQREAAPEGGLLPFAPSPEFLRGLGQELRCRQILFQAFPWNTPEPGVHAALLDLGVQSFASDFPDVAVRCVREYFASRAGQGA